MMVECNDDVAPTTIRDSGFLGVYYVAGYIVYSVGVRKIGQGLFLGTCNSNCNYFCIIIDNIYVFI